MSGKEPAPQMTPVESPQMISTVKLPMLKKVKYTLWSMRMEQYLTNTDYGLWQVIMNGDEPIQTTKDENGVETEVPLKTAQAILARQKERKAKSIMLLAIPMTVPNEDANHKFLRALPSSWNNVALIMRNKDGIDDLDIYDLYNNLKLFEVDIKGHNSQGQASSSSYTNDLMFPFFANQSNSPQLDDEDLEQIDHDDLEEMDLKWQVAMLSMRVKRFYKKTGRKLIFNGKEPVGYKSRDNTRRTVPVETFDALVVQDNALIIQDGLGYDWSYIAQDEPTEFALMDYTSNSPGSDTEVQSCSKNCVKTYEKLQKQFDEQRQTLSKANLEIVVYQLGLEYVEAQLIVHQKNEAVYEEKIAVLEFEVKDKGNAFTRLTNQLEQTLKEKEDLKAKLEHRSSDGDDNQTNDRFKKDNEYHAVPPPLIGNYMPPLADLSFAGLDDSVYRPTVNKTNAIKHSFKKIEFTKARNEHVKSDKQAVKPRMVTQSPKGNPQQALKYKGMFDSGFSRHMIGNKALLTDYQDIDGGFVSFGGSTRGGKITGIGKIRTNKIEFEDVFLVKELKFNLFSVSQMCDKKNSVLFTETECLVLSPDFKLIDRSQVLLRVPRKNNMYNFDLKNVVPTGDLTCLFEKAAIDESKLWHRRLGHVNFKTMNKLVKGNLVRGLPSKTFENDHTGVACQKGKQHKASCKTKHVSSISQPLQMLHMDLFGPTSIRSINHKTYFPVVTDDFSRFSWVFFLATKSETSGILKKFITEIENQLNYKAVEQHRLESRTFEVKMNQVLSENERLLAQAIDHDIVKTVVNLSVNDGCETVNECQKCLELKTELLNKKDVVKKNFTINFVEKQGLVPAYLKNELRKLKGKALDKEAIETHSVDPKVSKDNMEPITPKLLNKRTAHSSYIKHTQEEALVLRDIVEHVKVNYPQDSLLESAFRYTKVIQDLLSHISRTCPSINNFDPQLVAVTPRKKDKKVSLNKWNGTVKVNGSASVQNSKKHDNFDYVCINGDDCMSSDNLCVSNL
ncbi:putative ribonuclease H-like domain-containing protein [Tanacetum coccineum]